MKCKFCDNEVSELVDAHIIPRAFFEEIKKNENADFLLLMTNTPGYYTQKSWIGLYDNKLVCASCEEIFKPYDDYAIKLLLKTQDFEVIKDKTGRVGVWKKVDYDYHKLKLFFLTLLWRAGASDRKEFKRIQLGPHIDKIKEYIRDSNPGTEQEYSVILARFEDNDKIGRGFLLDPHLEPRKTFDGLNFYRFYLGAGYIAYIKVDKRPLDGIFLPLILSARNPLFILDRGNIKERKEFKLLKKLVNG
jgi:hypothetical protein